MRDYRLVQDATHCPPWCLTFTCTGEMFDTFTHQFEPMYFLFKMTALSFETSHFAVSLVIQNVPLYSYLCLLKDLILSSQYCLSNFQKYFFYLCILLQPFLWETKYIYQLHSFLSWLFIVLSMKAGEGEHGIIAINLFICREISFV